MRRVATHARIRAYPLPLRASILKARGCVVLFLCVMVCVVNGSLHAQGQKPSLFIGGSFASNKANASIDALDGKSPCGIFQNGNGGAPSMFGGITFPFTDKFSIDAKLEYDNLSTALETPATSIVKNTPLAYNLFNGSYDSILRNRYYNASLGTVGVAALVSYSIFSRLKISAGPFLGVLLQHSYNETEGLVYPADSTAVYKTGLPTRTIANATISNVNTLQTGIELAASYELPFEPHLALRPSFGATIPFTPITSHLYVYTIGASISLVYHFSEPTVQEPAPAIVNNIPIPQQAESKPVETPVPSSPLSPKRAMLTVSVKALGVGDDGREVSEPVISIERTHVTEVYPMLHYVFFDDGSSEIPERYHHETAATRDNFHEKDLFTANALRDTSSCAGYFRRTACCQSRSKRNACWNQKRAFARRLVIVERDRH